MESNDRVGVTLAQPNTYDERVAVAQTCGKTLGLGFPMLVDTIDDTVGRRYSGMPSRLYLIDPTARSPTRAAEARSASSRAELEQSLVLLLDEAAHAANTAETRNAPQGSQAKGGNP